MYLGDSSYQSGVEFPH
ncbi:hypothetical protein LINPERHAP1_LOCUS40446 [Linum perenne]